MDSVKNKIKAVILGHAVGDALGVPVEFCEREKLEDAPITDMVGYGTYNVPAGAWSDDTSMSLAALDSLAKGEIDYFEIMVNFAKWLEEGKYTPTEEAFDIGRTCLRSIVSFIKDRNNLEDGEYVLYGQKGEHSNGNGSLMRIHPFALLTWFDKQFRGHFEAIIAGASALTHAHKRSILACIIYTVILHSLLKAPQKISVKNALDEAKEKYRNYPEFEHYARLFDCNFDKLSRDSIKSSGYVVDTLEAAVWCLLTTDDYKSAVLKAVNLGGDTDTVAAVTGGLAGALYGYEAIPKEWLDTLIKRDYIEEMCRRAANTWGCEHRA